jgi:hypothetical protein
MMQDNGNANGRLLYSKEEQNENEKTTKDTSTDANIKRMDTTFARTKLTSVTVDVTGVKKIRLTTTDSSPPSSSHVLPPAGPTVPVGYRYDTIGYG